MQKIFNKKYILAGLICLAVFFVFDSTTNAAVTISVTPITSSVLPGSVRSVYSNVQGDANIAVTWSASGGSLVNFVGYTIWTAPQTPGTYTVTATSLADSAQSASSTFTVISNAVVKISNIPMQATIFKNQPLIVQNIIWGSTNTNVTWLSSGGTLRGAGREVVFSASTPGTYTVTAISQADNSKTAITTIVVTNNLYPGTATPNKTQPVDCTPTGSGTTYEVTSETTMDAVPWSTLVAGDTVRIHAGVVYHKQILISTSGTDSQPIRICGVPDASGNLPEINGANATAKAGTNFGTYPWGLQQYGGIIIYNYGASYWGGANYPKNIISEGLKLTGFHPSNTFSDLSNGNAITAYSNGAACIRVQRGGNITLRGNDISGCGNGYFTMAKDGIESAITRNLLVEGNYFHSNGIFGNYSQHQNYLQVFGLVIQGNYYDFPLAGMSGGQLKTRAVQQFVRYNYFEPAARMLDLVEVQDDPQLVYPWAGIDPNELPNTSPSDVVANYEAYQDKFIYGNILHNVGPSITGWMVHGAADNDQNGNSGGVLYLYDNTFFQTSGWRNGIIDFGPYYGTNNVWPTARLTNNAIYISGWSSGYLFFWNRYGPDRVILDKNWISDIWGSGNLAGGNGTGIAAPGPGQGGSSATWQGGLYNTQVSGVSNLITGSTMPFNSSSYAPNTSSPLINAGVSLSNAAALMPPLMQYSPISYLMSPRNNAQDIGAVAYSVSDTAPPSAPTGLTIQ